MMKVITLLLMILAGVSIAGCSPKYLQPDIYCPDPARPVMEKADDKTILKNYNSMGNYCLQLESQVKCYKKIIKD